ncbi:hypothetical protein [Amycolatopsis sp. NPDC051102]|uniref:hypothetical protein n=1 Tax=Amycolatopsis sp. NPDC051102 TaxID=3155163 RepID=UPI003440F73B
MNRPVSILTATAAALVLMAPGALAADNPDWHARCSTRVSPTETNNAEGWVNAQADGGNWKIVNIYASLRNVGGKITGDHQVTVTVFNGPGGPAVASHKFDNIANGDVTLTADVYPAVSVPKNKVAVQVAATTNIGSWPKLCNGTGIVF